MFTRSVVIQRHVEELQLGVKSYQKKLNLTKPDTYIHDLKRREAYTAYSNPRGFIYQNKDKKNRLMRIDELHKFSDGTLNDVRTALNDRLKGIQMEYLPQTIWRQSDKDKAGAMIQAIDKQLKTKRIMRSLEKFVVGRPYEEPKGSTQGYPLDESDKLILDTYGDTVSFKRRRDDEDKYEEPSVGSNWGSKRRRVRKELESTSAPKEKISKTTSKSTDGILIGFKNPAKFPTHDRDWNKTLHVVHGPVQPWLSNLSREEAGPTFELKKGTCKSLVELEYFFEEVYKATTDQLDWHNPKGQQYPHDLRKPLPLIPNFRGRQVIPFDHFINNDLAYLSGSVSSRTYATSFTKTKTADYGHIKWIEDLITVRRDDDKLYTFKEGDFKRLRLQDIEDMLIILIQGKLTNLNVERYDIALGVSLRIGFIYQKKDKKNKLMRIDELHKFSDGTLDDVRTALNDRNKRDEDGISTKDNIETFYTSAGNPVKEILLKLNLPDHRKLKDGGEAPPERVAASNPLAKVAFVEALQHSD
ncbi:hypothetical protein Tco_1320440 [Tanacetum coccineum]